MGPAQFCKFRTSYRRTNEPNVDESPRSKRDVCGASVCQSSRQYCLDSNTSSCFLCSKRNGRSKAIRTSRSKDSNSAGWRLRGREDSSYSADEKEFDSSSNAKSSESKGESEGSLSQSFSRSLLLNAAPGGKIPSQCSPSKGSSARISAHESVMGSGGGFAMASRNVFAFASVTFVGGRLNASYDHMHQFDKWN